MKHVVLIGGGHTHALVLQAYAKDAPNLRLTLIDAQPHATYSGMVPGYLAGHYTRDQLQIDLAQLAARAGATFLQAHVSAIDPIAKRLTLQSGGDIAYDIASLDIGLDHSGPGLPVKPFATLCDRWDRFVAAGGSHVAILGAGAAGCELALAAAHRLGQSGQVSLIDRAEHIAPQLAPALRHRLTRALNTAGVTLHLGQSIAPKADLQITATGGKPHRWLHTLTGPQGIPVAPTLQTAAHPDLFATGDCAHFTARPLPKAGVFAVRQAPILADNLQARAQGQPLRPYHPQSDYLKLLSLGGHSAIANWHGLTASGAAFWHLKDRIDRAFMARFNG
jgi:selenide, water dikinase